MYKSRIGFSDKRAAIRQQIIDGETATVAQSPTTSATTTQASKAEPAADEWFDPNLVPVSKIELGSGVASIEDPQVRTLDGQVVNYLKRGKTYVYCYTARFSKPVSNVRFGMLLKTISGAELGGASTSYGARDAVSFVEAGTVYNVQFQFRAALNPGTYFFNAGILGVNGGNEEYLARVMDIAAIKIAPIPGDKATATIDFECVSTFTEAREIA